MMRATFLLWLLGTLNTSLLAFDRVSLVKLYKELNRSQSALIESLKDDLATGNNREYEIGSGLMEYGGKAATSTGFLIDFLDIESSVQCKQDKEKIAKTIGGAKESIRKELDICLQAVEKYANSTSRTNTVFKANEIKRAIQTVIDDYLQ